MLAGWIVLIQALQDASGSVRESAAAALGVIGGGPAAQALIEASMADRDPWVRDQAAASLEQAFQRW